MKPPQEPATFAPKFAIGEIDVIIKWCIVYVSTRESAYQNRNPLSRFKAPSTRIRVKKYTGVSKLSER